MKYTVVASYFDPPSLFCTSVDAESPEAAVDAAWQECSDSNWGPGSDIKRTDEWSDTLVIEGEVKVV